MALSGSVFEIWHVTDRQTDRQTSAPFHDMATRSGPHNKSRSSIAASDKHKRNKKNENTSLLKRKHIKRTIQFLMEVQSTREVIHKRVKFLVLLSNTVTQSHRSNLWLCCYLSDAAGSTIRYKSRVWPVRSVVETPVVENVAPGAIGKPP